MAAVPLASDARRQPVADADGRSLAAAERAAADFLRALGVDLDNDHIRDSPARMARAWAELLTPDEFAPTTFANPGAGAASLVLVRDVPVAALCQHHLLPFFGIAHVAYVPAARLLGLSKFARVITWLAHRPQLQERLTSQLADWLTDRLQPRGVGVLIAAQHTCMTLRGACAAGSTTITTRFAGCLQHDADARREFFTLTEATVGVPPPVRR